MPTWRRTGWTSVPPAARRARLRLRPGEMAGLRAGDAAVEIDCGTGHPLADLARTVRPDGSVLAVEPRRKRWARTATRRRADLPYSSAPVEGNVTRIKMIKGQIYGRAGFALLRKRVILHSG